MSEEQLIDRFTEIDDLMRTSVELMKQHLSIFETTNRNIYDLLLGNTLRSGLVDYQSSQKITLTPEERKKNAKNRYLVTDHRDGQQFRITKTIIDEYSNNILPTTRFTRPPYVFNERVDPATGSQLEAISFSLPILALGGVDNPLKNDYLMITNIKLIGYENLWGMASSGIRVIFGSQSIPPNNAVGMPRNAMTQFDVSKFSPDYGFRVGDEDVLEFDFSKNPIILRSDKNDIFYYDFENLSGVEQHYRIAKTYSFLEPINLS